MTQHYPKRIDFPGKKIWLSLLLLAGFLLPATSFAQYYQRVYADQQQPQFTNINLLGLVVGGNVTDAAKAVDGNVQDHSNLYVTVGALGLFYATQNLQFSSPPAAGTAVTVKLGFGNSVLNLLGAVTVQPTLAGASVGVSYSGNSLLSLLSGNNVSEVTLTPKDASGNNVSYDGVRITVNTTLGVGLDVDVYHAYYLKSGPVICGDVPLDVLAGVGSYLGTINALSLGSVTNPYNAIDNDLTTYAQLNQGVQVGNYTQETVIFPKLSYPGDSVKFLLSVPDKILSLSLLSDVEIETFNGSVSNGSVVANNALLQLQLLGGGTQAQLVYTPVDKTFDRVQIRLGGLVGLLGSLNIYDVSRVIGVPTVTSPSGDSITICKGTATTLRATVGTGYEVRWYTQATGGTPVATGASYTTPVLSQSTTYYVAAGEAGCTAESQRVAVVVTAVTPPAAPVLTTVAPTICAGNSVTLAVTQVQGLTYQWYDSIAGVVPVGSSYSFTTPVLDSSITYYVRSLLGTCPSATRTEVPVTVNPLPATPTVVVSATTITAGQTTTLTASSTTAGVTFRWYNVSAPTVVVFTGSVFVTPPLTATTSYFVQAVTAAGCISATPAQVTITVNAATSNPVGCEAATGQTTSASGLLVIGGVYNPELAIDNNTLTASSLVVDLGLLNAYVAEKVTFNGLSTPGDTVRLLLTSPSQVLSLALLGGVELTTFQGTTSNGDAISIGNSLISLKLLSSNTQALVEFVPSKLFDGVQVKLSSGLAGVLTEVNFNYAQRVIAAPQVVAANDTICTGTAATLQVLNPVAGITYRWYDSTGVYQTGKDGTSFTTGTLTADTTFSVEAYKAATSCASSQRTTVNVVVTPAPVAPTVQAAVVNVCTGTKGALTVTNPVSGVTYNWYNVAVGGTKLNASSATTYTTGNVQADSIFYVEAVNACGASSARTQVDVSVSAGITAPVVTPTSATVTQGQQAVLTASSSSADVTFHWYTVNPATNPTAVAVANTAVYATPASSAVGSYTYYVTADVAGSCVSAATAVVVTVAAPGTPIAVPCEGASSQDVDNEGINLLGGVYNPTLAVDDDQTTGSSLLVGVGLLGAYVSQTVHFNGLSTPGDTVRILLNAPGKLLSLGILSSLQLTTYNGTTSNNDMQTVGSSSLINISLLSGDSKALVQFVPTKTFDGVRLQLNAGLVGALTSVDLNYAQRAIVQPTVQADSVTVCQGQQATLQVGDPQTGVTYKWYEGATYQTGKDGTSFVTSNSLATGIYTFFVKASRNGCDNTGNGTPVVLTVVALPVLPVAATTNPATTCISTPVTLSVVAQGGLTYNWYDSATGGHLLVTNNASYTTPASLTAGEHDFYVEASNGNGCTSDGRTKISIVVNAIAVAADIVVSNDTICLGDNVVLTPSSTTVTSPIFLWYANSNKTGAITTGVDANGVLTLSGLAAGTYTYYVSVSGTNKCENTAGTLKAVTVTVNDVATSADIVINDVTACQGESVTLTPSSTTATTPVFAWYANADRTGAITTNVSATGELTLTGLSAGVYTYYVSVRGANKCENAANALKVVTVTVNARSTAADIITTDATTCIGSTVTLLASSTTVTNPVFNWYSDAGLTTKVYTGSSFTTLALSASTQFYVTVAGSNQCENASGTAKVVLVTVNSKATAAAIIANDATVCVGDAATATATSTSVTNPVFNWYTDAALTSKVFTGSSYALSTTTAGANTFYITVTGTGVCENAAGDAKVITITVNPKATAADITANDAAICAGSATTLTASSTTVTNPVFNWYSDAGFTTKIYTGSSYTVPSTVTATTQYFVTVIGTDRCENAAGSAKVVTVTVSQRATASDITASDAAVCAGTAATIVASSATVTSPVFNWYSDASLTTKVYTGSSFPVPTTLSGTVQYYITVIGANVCENAVGSVKVVTVTVSTPATAADITVADATFCVGDAASITASSTTVTDPVFNWYTDAALTAKVFTGSTYPLTTTTAGSLTLYVTVNGSGVCENATGAAKVLTVTVNARAVASDISANDAAICSGAATTLTASSTTVTNPVFNWYTDAALTTKVYTGSSYAVPSTVTSSTQYYVTVTGDNKCENTTGAAKVVTLVVSTPATAADITASDATVCAGSSATLTATSATVTSPVFNWYSDAGLTTKVYTGSSFPVPGTVTGSVTYYVTVSGADKCENAAGDAKAVVLTVNPKATAADITANDATICSGTSTILTASSATVTNPVFNWYSDVALTTKVYTGTSFAVSSTLTATTQYYVTVTGDNTCENAAGDAKVVTVTVSQRATAVDITANNAAICGGVATSITASSATVTSPVFNWYSDASLTTKVYTGSSFAVPATLTATTQYYVTVSGANKCENAAGDAKVVTVTINNKATAADVTAPGTSICAGSMVTLTASSATVTNPVFNWYSDANLTTKLFTGASYATGVINAATQFYVTVTGDDVCENAAGSAKVVAVTLNSGAAAADVTVNDVTICAGNMATLNASSTTVTNPVFTWYSDASLSTVVHTGASYVTPVLSSTTQYYVTVRGDNKCENAAGDAKVVTVTTQAAPATPTISTSGTSICPGEGTTLTIDNPPSDITYNWYDAASGGTLLTTGISYTTPALTVGTTYYVEAINSNNCPSPLPRASVSVTILQPLAAPVVTIDSRTSTSITFRWTAVQGAVAYQVSLDDGVTYQTPSSGATGLTHTVSGLLPNQTATIRVRALGVRTCETSAASASASGVSDNPQGNTVFVPNVFSPNGDGNNDVLYVYGTAIASVEMRIYNQWGQLIFESKSQAVGWNGTQSGKQQPIGVYVYILKATMQDGTIINKKGSVSLIR